jgi:hypothetical protein
LKEPEMRKTLVAAATVATIAIATALPAPAQAGSRGGAVAAGIIGGLAAGAIIGSAARAAPPVYYEPAPAYAPPPVVYEEPACRIVRQRYWDGYGYSSRRVEVCD